MFGLRSRKANNGVPGVSATPRAPAFEEVFLGRQPIYDRNLHVIGHELLFRSSSDNVATIASGSQATFQVIMNALFDLGLDRIASNVPVFVNMPQDLIMDRVPEILPADRCVLEILENVVFQDDILERLAHLRAAGYRLALDDFVYSEDLDHILPMVDIVKIDVLALNTADLVEPLKRIRRHKVELLAEKIESESEFNFCKDLGFDYFQGYFLSRPEVLPGKRTPVDLATLVLVLQKCRDPIADAEAIADLISPNAALSYRLLQTANSAFHNRSVQITSVEEAVVFLGTEFVCRIASLFLLAGLTARPSHCLFIALQRALVCELLSPAAPAVDKGELYLVGLLSALDFLLGRPLGEVIPPLPLTEEVKSAIITRSGPLGRILCAAIAHEEGDSQKVAETGLGLRDVSRAYWQAVPRVEEFHALFDRSA
ncbi:MAG: EAL domain-containing protein [Bryobacteraceae bacterium]